MLRLVNAHAESPHPASRGGNAAAQSRRVAHENPEAATFDASDARWVLAARTAQLLQGGRSALLTPDRRRQLVSLAGKMGLRAFDAALIIAIVQDGAREGRVLGQESRDRLAFIRPAPAQGERLEAGMLLFVSSCLALLMFAALKAWLLG